MQNRRLTQDDNKGVQEILNETDSAGVGLKSSAKYYLHIFDLLKSFSKQREQQLRIDIPLQYFFSFDFKEPEDKSKVRESKSKVLLKDAASDGSNDVLVYRAFPMAKNQIMVRFENLADKFDTKTSFMVRYLNVRKFAQQFFMEANNIEDGSIMHNIKIEELSLSGNMLQSELQAHPNFKWKGTDDKFALNEAANKAPFDKGE